MNSENSELLLKASLGELSPVETEQLQDLLARSPEASAELERLKRLENLVAGTGSESFAPFFANRVMQRLNAEKADRALSLADSLAWLFYRTTSAALIVAVVLFAFSVVNRGETSQSLFETALGLPAVTLDAAYSFDATYYSRAVDDPTAGGQN